MAHFSQANIYKLKGMAAQAIASFQVVLRFRPDYAAVYMNMAAIYQTMNLPDQSVDVCLAGLKFEPNNGLIHGNLAIGLHQQGAQRRGDCSHRLGGRVAARRRRRTQQSAVLALYSRPDSDPARLFADHLAWARRHAEPLTATAPPHTNDRTIHGGCTTDIFLPRSPRAPPARICRAHDRGARSRAVRKSFATPTSRRSLSTPRRRAVRASADQWRVCDRQIGRRDCPSGPR